jgi:hypothetical protein
MEEVGLLIEKIKNAKLFLEEVYFFLDENDIKYDYLKVLE